MNVSTHLLEMSKTFQVLSLTLETLFSLLISVTSVQARS